MAGAFLGYDIKQDLKQDESKAEKAKDIGIDVGKNAFQFAGDEAIMTAAIALAPETMGMSLIAGVATSVLFNIQTGHLASTSKKSDEIKSFGEEVAKVANKGANEVKKDANKVAHFLKRLF